MNKLKNGANLRAASLERLCEKRSYCEWFQNRISLNQETQR